MKLNKKKVFLGLLPFDALGFKSEEELNNEILKLTKIRPEFESKKKVSSF